MSHAKVIAMTTTGAARYHQVLQDIQPSIVIIEEAAEVLEAHVITALTAGCQHLILIGDHKQLRPNPTVFELAKLYKLDISLFERMINNEIQCDTLEIQHRMRPEIAELVAGIYPKLQNHESVLEYDDVMGISGNLYFINHSVPEACDEELRSKYNDQEAKFLVALCGYMLKQG